MLALHTSDWHLGRALHGHDLLSAQAAFVDHLVDVVRAESVDAVLIAGDVHDRSIPPVRALELFDEALSRLRDAAAVVVVISGNHDAARRLGDKAGLLDPRISIRTDPAAVAQPVVLTDAHGPVRVYPLPYLEPMTAAGRLPSPPSEPANKLSAGASPAAIMRRAMGAVRADLDRHPGCRSMVVAHAWVTGGAASESERDISLGGVGNVPVGLFDAVSYTALGHLHRPQALTPAVRYSGSPLAFSFSEATDRKQTLLVEFGAAGLVGVRDIPVPAGRPLVVLRGTLSDLLTAPTHAAHEGSFVAAVLTDLARPVDAMATLRRRFPHALRLTHEPPAGSGDTRSFGARTRGRSDLDIATAFVDHVRSAPSARERALLTEALDAARLAEDAA